MVKKTQGISQRAYAKLAGVAPSYVQRLVAEGKLPTLPDGSLDRLACDEARKRTTVAGKGQRRWARRHGSDESARAVCIGCGGTFLVAVARDENGSPDPRLFCDDRCANDVAAGKSRAQIRARIRKGLFDCGFTPKDWGSDDERMCSWLE